MTPIPETIQAHNQKLTTTIQGHKVTMYFASEPNLELAALIKQTLLETYLAESLPEDSASCD
jgi:hypothetical protein